MIWLLVETAKSLMFMTEQKIILYKCGILFRGEDLLQVMFPSEGFNSLVIFIKMFNFQYIKH